MPQRNSFEPMGTNGRDRPANEQLAERARPIGGWLRNFFRRRVRDDDETEDLVQDVFARIAARDSSEPIGQLSGYVMKTANSVLADRARRRSARHADLHVVLDDDWHGEDELDPERIASGKQELDVAIAALLTLPERTRTIFILRRLEGFKNGEIAAQLGISVSAVEKHVVKAVQHLGSELEARDVA